LQAELDVAAQPGNVADVRAITKDMVDLAAEVRADTAEEPRPVTPDFAAWRKPRRGSAPTMP
jgi:hypothetical protein